MNAILTIIIIAVPWLMVGAFFSALVIWQNRSWDIYRVRRGDLFQWVGMALAGPIASLFFLIDFLWELDNCDFWRSPIWKKRK